MASGAGSGPDDHRLRQGGGLLEGPHEQEEPRVSGMAIKAPGPPRMNIQNR